MWASAARDCPRLIPVQNPVGVFVMLMRLLVVPAQGPLKFYTGFPTYCVRIAPHVTLTLVFLDALKKAQGNMGM